MATTTIGGTKIVYSSAGAAVAETFSTTDASLDTTLYFNVLAQDGGGNAKILWSLDNSQIAAGGWTTNGGVSIPTALLTQDTAYGIDSTSYQSKLGANIFLTAATGLVGYDLSSFNTATKLRILNLAVGQTLTDSFDYSIRLSNGTLSWNTVTVVISGAAPTTRAISAGATVSGGGFANGSTEVVSSGGTAVGAILGSGGSQTLYGTASNTVIYGGGTETVASGGTASGTTVSSGGTETVQSGGVDVSATISSGGFQDVFGNASGTLIVGGGRQTVEKGGIARGTVLDDNAVQTVASGGTAISTIVSATDSQVVLSGGLASATTVSSGGFEIASAGGTTSDTTIAGGTLELGSGALTSGAITFVGSGGILQIDGTAMPAGPISGFAKGDEIDLRALPWNGGNTVSFDLGTGLLTVSGGGLTDALTLSGVASGTQFTLVADGSGGTLVENAPSYNYQAVEPPGSRAVFLNGMNSNEDVTGYYYDGTSVQHGFIYHAGGYTTLDEPGAIITRPSDINDSGQLAGMSIFGGFITLGFLYTSGTFTDLYGPPPSIGFGIQRASATGINDSGTVVGSYTPPGFGSFNTYGFIYDQGTYTTLSDPASPFNFASTQPVAINNPGQVLGTYLDTSFKTRSFIYSNGSYTNLQDPFDANGTVASGINDSGQVVGTYFDANDTPHGFLYSGGTYTTLDPLGTLATEASGINNLGQAVGDFTDTLGTHGFLYEGGKYTALDAPFAGYATLLQQINDPGSIVGRAIGAYVQMFLYSGGTYTTVGAPSPANPLSGIQYTSITPLGITDSSEIVGYYNDGSTSGGIDGTFGFIYNNGTYTKLKDPGAVYGTFAAAVNQSGQVVGTYNDGTFTNGTYTARGFLYNNGGFTDLDVPSGYNTKPAAINSSGQVVGQYTDNIIGSAGFLYSGGVYTTLTGGAASGINDTGQVVGSDGSHGYLYDSGSYTVIDAPNAVQTLPLGINDLLEIIGSYNDSNNVSHGFIYDHGGYTVFDAPAASSGTYLTGFNDIGDIVGYYGDGSGTHGFIRHGNGSFTTVDETTASNGTYAAAINHAGQVVGTFYPPSEHDFLAVPI